MSRFPSFSHIGVLFLTLLFVSLGHPVHAQLDADRESSVQNLPSHQTTRPLDGNSSRSSSASDLPSWAEPNSSSREMTTESVRAKNNPGLPGDPEQDIPIGGGGAVLLVAAGTAYAVRRLHDADAEGDPLSPQ